MYVNVLFLLVAYRRFMSFNFMQQNLSSIKGSLMNYVSVFLLSLVLASCSSADDTTASDGQQKHDGSSNGTDDDSDNGSGDDADNGSEDETDNGNDSDEMAKTIQLAYDFDDATVAQNGGWGYVLAGYGSITQASGEGLNGSNALYYTDENEGTNIENQSMLWHVWGDNNPWSAALASAQGDEIVSVNMYVKVIKADGNTGTDEVTVQHNLLPWNISGSNKFEKVTAAQEVSPEYAAKVSSADFGQWVELSFIDYKTGQTSFIIPSSWQQGNGSAIVDVLPAFFFGGLEEGDTVVIDGYELVIEQGNGNTSDVDEGYGLHDGSGTYTSNPRPEPLPIVDSEFYVEPTVYGVSKNAVNDYNVNNTDSNDDTGTFQNALDAIAAETNGGKLHIPAGDYYVRSLHLRSNVHLEIDEGATFHMATGGGYNVWMFEMGNGNQGKAENFSVVGLGNGFTVDLTDAPNIRTAVFKMGDIENFKFSNINIKDGKTIFASFMVGITTRNNEIYWPVNGIIENIDQSNSLFGYGLVQMYGADQILFRNLHSEGGITLRMETDNLTMKNMGKGGIRNIFAENISGTNCLAPVMFGPHFQQNGSVQVNGVVSNSCGFAVRVDNGYVELFSPSGYTREQWQTEVNETYGTGCAGTTYGRGQNQMATRINHVGDCLDKVHKAHGLKPGWYAESYVYNVTANYGNDAHLKQNQLDYFDLSNPSCSNVCLPTEEQWAGQGQIYLGPALGGTIDYNKPGVDYNFNINIDNLQMQGFPEPSHISIDADTTSSRVCNYYGMAACPTERWQPTN